MRKKVLSVLTMVAVMSFFVLQISPPEAPGAEVVVGDLEGPDYIRPPKHYKTLNMMLAEAGMAELKEWPPAPVPVSGTREILVILVELSDVARDPAHTTAYFHDRFFSTTAPSVRHYYTEVSYDNFTYVPGAVVGWYSSTYDQNQWVNVDKRPVVEEAIQNADADFNFAPYDTNSDGFVVNEELTIFIIVSGNQGGASHWWTLNPVTADGVTVGEWFGCEFNNTHEDRHIGTYAHELGHSLGLPDLYDTDNDVTGDSEGIGNYGLMGGGSWTFSHMTAWSKIQLGWITPTIVTTSGYYDVHDSETNPEAYILIDPTHSSDEYFLIENKRPQNSYYETTGPPVAPGGTFPDEGIIIYHIDDARMQDWITSGTNNVNADETHKGVDVETAEHPTSHVIDADDLDIPWALGGNRGDPDDLWDSGEYDFNDTSVPCNAEWYNTPSEMGVSQFPAAGNTMTVYFSVPGVVNVNIIMESDWNLISIPVQLPDNTLDTVLQSIAGLYSSIWTYDAANGQWKRYVVGGPGFLNNLETMEAGKGYWIQMIQMAGSAVLTLNGDAVASGPIPLKVGWNLVGYNSLTAQSLQQALLSIAGNYNSVWTYDAESGQWKRYVVGGPGFLNNLENMEPGKGYWIDTIADGTLDVSGTASPAPTPLPVAAELGRSHVSTDRPGIPYVIWGSVEADGVKVIGAGSHAPTVLLKVDDKVQSSCRLGTVGQYGDFYVLDVPEASERTGSVGAHSSAQIELYVQIDDTVMKAATVPPGRPGQIMRLDLSVKILPKVSLLHQNYPNPFNPDTWIPYQLEEDADVVIKIYTAAGQLVRTLNLGHKPAGFYTDREKAAYWDGNNEAGESAASGVYFYSIKAGDLTTTRKMVIVK